MPRSHVDAGNHSVDNMGITLGPKASIYHVKSSISVFSGDGCADHLNNILTVDVSNIGNNERIDGLICDSNGRVEDIVSCFGIGSEIIILGILENMESTRLSLTTGIPWDKNFLLYDGNDALKHCVVHGDEAAELLTLIYPDMSEISDNEFLTIGDVIISKNSISSVGHFDILYRSDDESFIQRIKDKSLELQTSEEWECARIRSGLPSGNEADSTRLPSDIGLGTLVSLNKGCYPGQEIHARLDSRGSVRKHMLSIASPMPINLGKNRLEGGLTINVTSTREFDGGHIALAVAPTQISEGTLEGVSGQKFEVI